MEENINNIHVLELSSYTSPSVVVESREDWVDYLTDGGEQYYDWLIQRYKCSTTNNSIINNVARLCYGKGLDALDASKKPNEYAAMKALFQPDMLRSSFQNEYMLGSGVIQVIYNKAHTKILKAEKVQTRLVRPEKCDKDGNINGYYFSNDWSDTKKYPPKRYPAFGTSKEEIEFLVYGKDSIDLKYFSEVDYQACLPYCVLEEEIADYQINDIQNHFSGTKVINFNNGVGTEEQRRETEKKVRQRLQGSKGDKVIIAFNNNETQKTTIEDVALADAPEHYAYLSEEAQSKILNNHNVISSMLVGITTTNSGFSSNGDEIEVATKFFHNQTIKPHQELLIDALDQILAFNGISLKLYFKSLNYLETLTGEEKPQPESEFSVKFSHWLDAFGENESEEWELIDAREVDYDLEDELDMQFSNWGQTKLQKILLATGIASPNRPSSQDREIDGFHFKVRYKYVGSESPERGFCREMMRAAKIYRKEDIIRMGKAGINKDQAHGNEDMNIWLYKGGVACKHKWERRTYVSTTKSASIGSQKTSQISTNKARKFGYNPVNEKEVSQKPHDMPRMGHHPNYNK